MGIAIGAIGMVGFAGCLVWFLILLILKKSKEPAKIGLIVCVVLFFVGILTDVVSGDNEERRVANTVDVSSKSIVDDVDLNDQSVLVDDASSINSLPGKSEPIDISGVESSNVSSKNNLKGRGWSDSGRSEPQYESVVGYVVIDYMDVNLAKTDDCFQTPWTVHIYEKDKQFYNESGFVAHKTPVVVKTQELNHEGYGAYSGHLIVERIDGGEELCIDVGNFITNPYWESSDLIDAASIGYYIAEFKQVSDYFPVSKSNEKVDLEDGTKVLVTGKTGLYGRGGPDNKTNQIQAKVFKEWKYGYGGVSVFFNADDLTILY